MRRLISWISRKTATLRHLPPSKICVVAFVAVIGGLFPVPGCTTPATIIIGKLCQFSPTEIALSGTLNFFLTPFQIIMIPLWGRGFAALLGRNTDSFTFSHVKHSISNGNFLASCLDIIFFSVLAWLITAVTIVLIIRSFQNKKSRLRAQPQTLAATQHLQEI